MMASEYKHAMQDRGEEPYTTDKSEQSESQRSLTQWGNEDWQTSDGSGTAKQADGTERRYLPTETWKNLTAEETEATNEAKLEGSKRGEQVSGNDPDSRASVVLTSGSYQYVPNTNAAKDARKATTEDAKENMEVEANGAEAAEEAHGKSQRVDTREDVQSVDNGDARVGEGPQRGTKHKRDEDEDEEAEETKAVETAGDVVQDDAEENDSDAYTATDSIFGASSDEDEEPAEDTQERATKKAKGNDGEERTTAKAQTNGKSEAKGKASNKSKGAKKTAGDASSGHPGGEPGSATRLPQEGQAVHWKANTWCEGKPSHLFIFPHSEV